MATRRCADAGPGGSAAPDPGAGLRAEAVEPTGEEEGQNRAEVAVGACPCRETGIHSSGTCAAFSAANGAQIVVGPGSRQLLGALRSNRFLCPAPAHSGVPAR